MHICITARHTQVIDELIADLKEAVHIVKTTPASKEGFAPVYGLAASLPDLHEADRPQEAAGLPPREDAQPTQRSPRTS